MVAFKKAAALVLPVYSLQCSWKLLLKIRETLEWISDLPTCTISEWKTATISYLLYIKNNLTFNMQVHGILKLAKG